MVDKLYVNKFLKKICVNNCISYNLIKIIVKGDRALAASSLILESWSGSTSAQRTGEIPVKPESFRFQSFQQGDLQELEKSHIISQGM